MQVKSIAECSKESILQYFRPSLIPQSHTHLRTLRMVRKARPQLSVHSVTIRITSAENVTVRILSATYRKVISIRAQILKNIKKVLRMKTTQ